MGVSCPHPTWHPRVLVPLSHPHGQHRGGLNSHLFGADQCFARVEKVGVDLKCVSSPVPAVSGVPMGHPALFPECRVPRLLGDRAPFSRLQPRVGREF